MKTYHCKVTWRFLLSALCLMLITNSCKKEESIPAAPRTDQDECLEYETSFIDTIYAPRYAVVNIPVEISVLVRAHSGCGHFYEFETNEKHDTTYIEPITRYLGCTCTANEAQSEGKYRFTKDSPGDYVLVYEQNTKYGGERKVINIRVNPKVF